MKWEIYLHKEICKGQSKAAEMVKIFILKHAEQELLF